MVARWAVALVFAPALLPLHAPPLPNFYNQVGAAIAWGFVFAAQRSALPARSARAAWPVQAALGRGRA